MTESCSVITGIHADFQSWACDDTETLRHTSFTVTLDDVMYSRWQGDSNFMRTRVTVFSRYQANLCSSSEKLCNMFFWFSVILLTWESTVLCSSSCFSLFSFFLFLYCQRLQLGIMTWIFISFCLLFLAWLQLHFCSLQIIIGAFKNVLSKKKKQQTFDSTWPRRQTKRKQDAVENNGQVI